MSSPSTGITMNASRNQRTAESAHSAEGHRSGARSSFWRWSSKRSDLRFAGMAPESLLVGLAVSPRSQASVLVADTFAGSTEGFKVRNAAPGPRRNIARPSSQTRINAVNLRKELAVLLEDRPGTPAKATNAIASAGINIEGFCALPCGKEGKAVFHVQTSDPASTGPAARGAGFKVHEEWDTVLIDAENGPGFLAEVLRKVADHELNVGPIYSITDNRIAITADDFGKLRVLQELASAARRP